MIYLKEAFLNHGTMASSPTPNAVRRPLLRLFSCELTPIFAVASLPSIHPIYCPSNSVALRDVGYRVKAEAPDSAEYGVTNDIDTSWRPRHGMTGDPSGAQDRLESLALSSCEWTIKGHSRTSLQVTWISSALFPAGPGREIGPHITECLMTRWGADNQVQVAALLNQ